MRTLRRQFQPSPQAALLGTLGLYLLLAVGYSLVVPLGEAPDEVSHYAYVRWLAIHQRLPEPQGAVFGEVFQPPLYYALVAPLTAWQPDEGVPVEANGDFELGHPVRRVRVLIQPPAARWPWRGEALAWHVVRLASALFGAVGVVATYRLARLVVPASPWAAVLAAAFVAFVPQFTFQGGTVTNDTPATALSALGLLALVSGVRRAWRYHPATERSWRLAGLLGGLGVWAKTSGWVLAGTAFLAWALTWREPGRWRRLLALVLPWGGVAAPWLAWNLWQYGDPFGWALMHQVTDERVGPLTWPVFREVLQGLYRTFWAGFGGAAHISLPSTLNAALGIWWGLAVVGLGWLAWVRWRRRARHPDDRSLILLGLLAAHVALVLAAWVQWTRTVLGTGQGRLIFPALPALAVLLASGWLALVRRWRAGEGRAVLTMAGLWGLFGAWVLVGYLRPLYVVPPPVPSPPETVEAGWAFGEGLWLRRYFVPWTVDHKLPPGTQAEAYFEWEAIRPLDDRRLLLQLIDDEGRPVWVKEGTPSAGRDTTDQWPPHTPVGAWHRIEIPPGTPPGWYRLMLSVHTPDERALPMTDEQGNFLGEQVMVGQVTVVEQP